MLIFSIGSNIGNKAKNIDQACTLLTQSLGPIAHRSSLYESEPWGVTDQDQFYNIAIAFDTDREPDFIKQEIKRIESLLGRDHAQPKWHARVIDIDLIYRDQDIWVTKDFQIPHKQMHLRKFVLIPLCEILPKMLHPVFRKTTEELLENCPDDSKVKRVQDAV